MTSRTALLVFKSATDHVISPKDKENTQVKSDGPIGENDSIADRKRHCGCLQCFSLWPASVSPDGDNIPSNERTQEFKPERRLLNSESTLDHNKSLTGFGYPATEEKTEKQYLNYGHLNAQLCTQLFPNNPIWSDEAYQDRDLKARDIFHFLSLLSILKYSTLYLASYKFDKGLVWIKVTQAKYKINAKNNLRCLKLTRERPFFTQLISHFKTQHGFYLVSTCQGRCTLDYYLKLHGALKVKDVQFYAVEIVHALVYLHGKEVIHRSLSSHNIMLDNTGHLFISDFSFAFFGLSCANQDFDNVPNSYTAPEILNGQAYTKAVDWWALGVIMYEMLYCQLPFEGRDVFQSIVTLMTLEPTFKFKDHGTKAIYFCRALLAKSASKRLGSGPDGSYHVLSHTFLQGVDWSNLRWRPAETHLLPAEYTSCCSAPEDCASLCSAESSVTLAEWQEKRAITKKANTYFKIPDRDLKTDRYQSPRSASKEDAEEPQHVESKTLILHPRNPHRENFISSTLRTLDKVYVLKIQPGESEGPESPVSGTALRTDSREKRAGNLSQVNSVERGCTDENASASGTAEEERLLNIFQVRRSKFKGFSIVSKGSVLASEACSRRNSVEEDEGNITSLCDIARNELSASSDSDGDDIEREWSKSETDIDKDIQMGSDKDRDERDRMPSSKIGSGKGNHRGGGWIDGNKISSTFSSARRIDAKPDKQESTTAIEILPPAQRHTHPPQLCNETIRANGIAALESDDNISKTITVDNTGKTDCILSNQKTSTLDQNNTTSTDVYHNNNNSSNGDSSQPNKDETSDNQGASQHGSYVTHAPAIKRVGSRSQPSKCEGTFQDVVQCEGPEDIKNGTVEAINSCALLHGVSRLPLRVNDVSSATHSFKEASGQRCVPSIDAHVTSTEAVGSLYNFKPSENPGPRDTLYQDDIKLDSDSCWYGQSDLSSCHPSPLVDTLCFGDTTLITNVNRDIGSGSVNNETLVDFCLHHGSQSLQLKELVAIGCTNNRIVFKMSTKSTDQVVGDQHGKHQSPEESTECTHNSAATIRGSPQTHRKNILHQEHGGALQFSNSNVEHAPWASRRSPINARPDAEPPPLRQASFLGYVTRKLDGNMKEQPGSSRRARDPNSSVSATMSASSAPENQAAHRAFDVKQLTRRSTLSDQHSQGSGSYKVYLNKIASPPPGSSRARKSEQNDIESRAKAALSSYEQFRRKLSFLNLFKRRNVTKPKGINKSSQLPAGLPETLKEADRRKKKSGFFLLRKRSRTSENDGTKSFTSLLHDHNMGPSQDTDSLTGVTRRENSLRLSMTRDADSNGVGFTQYYKTVTDHDIPNNSKPIGAAPPYRGFQKKKSTSEDSNSGTRFKRISIVPTIQHDHENAPKLPARSLLDPGSSGINGNQSADETTTPPKHAPESDVFQERRQIHSPAEKNAFPGQDFDCDLMTPEIPTSRGQRVVELHRDIRRDLVPEGSDGGESMYQNNSSDDDPETNGSGRLEHIETIEGTSMVILERGLHHTGNDFEDTTNSLGLNTRGQLAEEAGYNLRKEAEHYWSASKLKFQYHSFNELDKMHDDTAVDSSHRTERKLQSKSSLDLCQEPLKMLPKCKSVHHLNLILDGKPLEYCLDKLNLIYPRKSSLKLHLPDEKFDECDTVDVLQSKFSEVKVGQVIRENELENVTKHMEPTYLVTSLQEAYSPVALHSIEDFNSSVTDQSPDSNMETSSGIKSLVGPLLELHSSEIFNSSVVEPSLDRNVEPDQLQLSSSEIDEKTDTKETSKASSRNPPEDKSPEQEKTQSASQRRRQLMSDLDAITPCNDCDVWPRNDRRCSRLRQVNYDTSSRYLYGDVSSNDHGQGEGLEVIGTLTIECLVPPVNGLIYRNHVTS